MAISADLRALTRGRAWVRWLKRLWANDHIILGGLAILIGVAAGLAAIGFRYGIDLFRALAYGNWIVDELFNSYAAQMPWWRVLLATTLGGLAIGLFLRYVMPDRKPQGVADVIESVALRGGQLRATDGLKAATLSAASIGVGASVGREGPVVHLGASLASCLAGWLHLGRRLTRTLLGCGVAAAIAASFNAPIAGVFFALEVVVGHYALSAFAPIVIASVAGTVVSRMHYGDFPAFILPQSYEIASFWEFPAFALLGLAAALLAIVFTQSVAISVKLFERAKIPVVLRPAVAGLAIGCIALAYPEVLGVGYEATDKALQALYSFETLVILLVLKVAATAICLGAGFGGGVFSPSLFLGAMLGGAFGIVATQLFPELSSGSGAYTVIGMGAVAGAVLGAPISTILMIFELTGDYELTIALMVATAIASVVVQQANLASFFAWQLARRGVNLRRGQETEILNETKVRSLLDSNYATVAPEAPFAEVRDALVRAPFGELMVCDGEGALRGTITFAELAHLAFDSEAQEKLTAEDLARKRPPVLLADDGLSTAIRVFQTSAEPHLPVVDNKQSRRLLGFVHEHEAMTAYHRALQQVRREESGEG